ncbi:thioredoxin family protein [Singulisphaera acidiphila]|uniref:thioredoxin family protein n=1 Tax=Singulisphaera acidiphila TaxID=466153 RepID=UPI001ED9816D|nr:thioredoxin family protein [Singulisphaera acidiphila]
MTRINRSFAAALLLAVPTVANAQDANGPVKKAPRPSIYDVKADADEQIKVATALARRDARRVLVMFGGDWCGWCHKLHGLFASNAEIRGLLADEYILVMVDTQSPHAEALLAKCRGDLKGVGYPFLAVLDGQGNVVTRQQTDPLEEGDHHDPAKVKAFLEEWVAPKVAASKVFEEGLAKASSEDKLVFLHFGTPTCGWCHKLEAFLAREDMAPIFARDFVDTKLDLSRMIGADEILEKYTHGKAGGVPWFVFLDAKGKAVVTSDGPKGNIGYPAAPEEIAHFVSMLRKVARKMDSAQIDAVEAALKSEAKQIEAARGSVTR